MDSRLTKQDWLRAARLALLTGGRSALRVETVAQTLGVTKGSFYWHFADRAALAEALLSEWEDEADLLIGAVNAGPPAIESLLEQLASNVFASERGEVPSDAAIFAWAAVDPSIRTRVDRAEEERVGLLAAMLGGREKAELAYMAYLGFILRRRHSADPEGAFARLADFFRQLAAEGATGSPPREQESGADAGPAGGAGETCKDR